MHALRPEVNRLVVSVFVNPLQFGEGEDLDTYPRDLERDAAVCEAAGVDVLFTPTAFYPKGFATGVSVSGLTEGLCGADRPGHFDGVTTVVCRLFGVSRCHHAAFGEKDYQQLAVIRRMVRDLALPVQIHGVPISRDEDGLARSSRNAYLSEASRERALSLSKALTAMVNARAQGQLDVGSLKRLGMSLLSVDQLDYLEVVDAQSLQPLATAHRPARVLIAAKIGGTRLIDNMAMPVP